LVEERERIACRSKTNKRIISAAGKKRSVALSHKAILVFLVANVKSTHRCYKKGLHNLKNSATCFPCLHSNPCNMTSYTMFGSTEFSFFSPFFCQEGHFWKRSETKKRTLRAAQKTQRRAALQELLESLPAKMWKETLRSKCAKTGSTELLLLYR